MGSYAGDSGWANCVNEPFYELIEGPGGAALPKRGRRIRRGRNASVLILAEALEGVVSVDQQNRPPPKPYSVS